MVESKDKDTLRERAHDLARRKNEERTAKQKAIQARDAQTREALLRRKSSRLMADDLHAHLSTLVLEHAEEGRFSTPEYTLPITNTTRAAVRLVQDRFTQERITFTCTESPRESTLGKTNCDFLHLTLSW